MKGPIRGEIPDALIEAVRVAVGDEVFARAMAIIARMHPDGVSWPSFRFDIKEKAEEEKGSLRDKKTGTKTNSTTTPTGLPIKK